MTSLGRSRSLQSSSGSPLLRDGEDEPFLAPGISGLQHFRATDHRLEIGWPFRTDRRLNACSGSTNEMNVIKILDELRQEQHQLAEAILSLERLSSGRGKRPGRPRAWIAAIKKRGRSPGSKNKSKA